MPPISPFQTLSRFSDDSKSSSAILSEKEVRTRNTILIWLGIGIILLLIFFGGGYFFLDRQNLFLAEISRRQEGNFGRLNKNHREIVATFEKLSWQNQTQDYFSGQLAVETDQDEKITGYYRLNSLFQEGRNLSRKIISDNNLFSQKANSFILTLLYSDEFDSLIDNTNYHGQELVNVFEYLLETNKIFSETSQAILSIHGLSEGSLVGFGEEKVTALAKLKQDYDRIYLVYPLPDDLSRLHDKKKLLLEENFALAQGSFQNSQKKSSTNPEASLVLALNKMNYLVFFEELGFWQTSKTAYQSGQLAQEWQETTQKISNKFSLNSAFEE